MRSSSKPEERAQFTVAELLARYGDAPPASTRRHRRAPEHPEPTVRTHPVTTPVVSTPVVSTPGQPLWETVPVTPPLFAGQTPMSRTALFDGPVTERLPRLDPPPMDPVIRVLSDPSENTEAPVHPAETASPLRQPAEAGSPLWEWAVMMSQIGIGVVGGAALWLSCEWLWQRIPVVALIVSLAMITGLVWVVRRVRRAEDLQTTVIAVLVGLFVTVSPAALLLVGR